MEQGRLRTGSNLVKYKQPCPKCTSSDAYFEYDDGHGWCFSCTTYFKADPEGRSYKGVPIVSEDGSYQIVPDRGISENTMQKFGALTHVDEWGIPTAIHFTYGEGKFKVR